MKPENAKALYRRGVAKLCIGLLDEANEDLLAADKISPNGNNI